jgi:hypothetical protein
MTHHLLRHRWPFCAAVVLALGLMVVPSTWAQDADRPMDPWRPQVLPPGFDLPRSNGYPAEPPAIVPPRPRFFRMPLDLCGEPFSRSSADEGSPGNRLQVFFGEDSPFLDLRKPGEPGGAGYQKLNTQVHLLDTGTTGLIVGLQAVRPSGAEFDGLNGGPTVVSPAVGLVQELGEGTALHGFVGKDVRPGPQWTDNFESNLQYGMAVQTPLPLASRSPRQSLHVFVEALGRYRHEADLNRTPPAAWEVLPGVHWRNADHWWMSGGVLVPLGPGRVEGGVLQITCGMQF